MPVDNHSLNRALLPSFRPPGADQSPKNAVLFDPPKYSLAQPFALLPLGTDKEIWCHQCDCAQVNRSLTALPRAIHPAASRRKKVTSNPVVRRLTGEAVGRCFVPKCAGFCATRMAGYVGSVLLSVTCGIWFESCPLRLGLL